MQALSYRGYRFPPAIIQHAVWLYLRFTLSFRDVEDLFAERGVIVSHETIRRWVAHFGPIYARRLRSGRPPPTGRWHLDEVFVSIAGKQMYLWRAVDDEGEVLDILVQSRRDKDAALRLMRKLLKRQGLLPTSIVTTGIGPTMPRFASWAFPTSTDEANGRTTAPRVRTCRSDDENGRCRVSDRPDQRSVFSLATQPSTTRSTSAAI